MGRRPTRHAGALALAVGMCMPAGAAAQAIMSFQVGAATRTSETHQAEILEFQQSLGGEPDAATARATGRRVHHPIRIVKSVDRSSPILLKACANGEAVPSVEFAFGGTAAAGDRYTIRLEDVRVTSVTTRYTETERPVEEVTFTYGKIRWTHAGGTEFEAAWSGPRGGE